ncbi:MAG: class I SAM-dependent methyltransferase [Sphingobium sp.]|nr:class I SAM-dependent methyltransferase [Sphingobium sp.]
MVVRAALSGLGWNEYRSFHAYERYLTKCLRENPRDRRLAFARAVGAETMESYIVQGDGHVAVLRYHGLQDGMSLFDLGCGCGRTAEALMRSGWVGQYVGVDVTERFVAQLRSQCPGYRAFRHRSTNIPMPDDSLDLLFHWSVFTHLSLEECFLYLRDSFRALKPGAKTVFSFLELTDPGHRRVHLKRIDLVARGRKLGLLDTFLHRDWLRYWAAEIGFEEPQFTDGTDSSNHPAFWQSVVSMTKPAI